MYFYMHGSLKLHNDPMRNIGSLLSLFYRSENGGSERLVVLSIIFPVMCGRARN